MKKHKTKKLKSKQGYFKNQLKIFIDSFKQINRNYSFVILFDLFFYLLGFGIISLWGFVANKMIPASVKTDTPALMEASTFIMKKFFFQFSLLSLLVVILLIAAWSISKLLIWNRILNKKFNWMDLKDFFLLNLLWFLITIIVLVFPVTWFIIHIKENNPLSLTLLVGVPLLILFVLYLTTIMYIVFVKQTKKQKLIAIKDSFLFGVKKIRHFIILGIGLFIVFILIGLIMGLFELFPQALRTLISILILLAFFAWLRYYFADIVEKVETNKL